MATEQALPPDRIGPPEAEILIVGWGSTRVPLREAVLKLDSPKLALLRFFQVFPIAPAAQAPFAKARKLILVEGNATGQFGKLLQLELGVSWAPRILKHSGSPFAAEELQTALSPWLDGEEQT